ncbi:MAG TPA: SGNH/GDSL hydrolase family protein [Flavobacteriales bacterium]|nr:SGNH/GDSL hydrolase family protein [Flavobacteriales bacterium]
MKATVYCILLSIIGIACTIAPSQSIKTESQSKRMIRYAAIGDSYTIGESVEEGERWPNLMVSHLKQNGIAIEIVANPSVTGWTTQDLIDKELPIFRSSNPDFATLLIGVNDWVQKVSIEKFRANLRFIIEEMLKELSSAKRIVAITIPDFGATPAGPQYSGGRDISAGLSEFNGIIMEECENYGIACVDIFQLSQDMKDDQSLVANDGLHPSAKEYVLWEELIYPVVAKLLQE